MDIKTYLKQVDAVVAAGPYEDSWESLCTHPIPEWYQKGRFGLFIHWGVFSIPAFVNEWYPRAMYYKNSKENKHHVKTYGPLTSFGYKDFIPMFKAEKFDPEAWLHLFEESGAKYIMPVGEHHDGFKLYGSDLNRWNSVEMGPKRDLMKELHEACDRHGIGFCTSSHRAEHFWFLNGGRTQESDVQDETLRDFYGPSVVGAGLSACERDIVPTVEWLEDWLASTCELVDKTQPQALYFDWWVRQPLFRPYMKKFLAYYYNRGQEWGKQVTVFYKWDSIMYGAAIYDVERGQLDSANPRLWQNDTAIAKNSWGYTHGNAFKTPSEVLCNLIDVISKNGCFMLNVGPKADGSICEEEANVLREIGKWMRINGEGIYDAKSYKVYGEGKKKKVHGTMNEKSEYNKFDFRYTYQPGSIYAFALIPNAKGVYKMKSLGSGNDKCSFVHKNARVLGYNNKVSMKVTTDFLELSVEGELPTHLPLCFKIEID